MSAELNYIVAISTVRILAGVLFFFQGYDKIAVVGMKQLQATMRESMGNKRIPGGVLGVVAFFTSWIELLGGLFLIFGFLKYAATYVLCLDLLIVATGFSLARPMWDSGHVLFRLILLLFILLSPAEWDVFSIDNLLRVTA